MEKKRKLKRRVRYLDGPTDRKNFTLSQQSIGLLVHASNLAGDTPSKVIDQLIKDAFLDKREQLMNKMKFHLQKFQELKARIDYMDDVNQTKVSQNLMVHEVRT